MSEKEILEMQRRIDEGIRLAQKRLWERARTTQQTLVVCNDGEIVEMVPDGDSISANAAQGDPLMRRKNR